MMKIAFALTALVFLAGCATSPMRVEYRVEPTKDPRIKAAEDAALLKRIRERSQRDS